MPRYECDIDYIIDEDRFAKLFNHTTRNTDRTWITILWFTAARPAEVLELTSKDITIETEKIIFRISTKKLGAKGKFMVRTRTLILNIPCDHRYVKAIRRHLYHFQHKPELKIFTFSQKTGSNIIQRLGYDALGVQLCPYNFRHSRMTLLAEKGATEDELKRFKGSRSTQSVRPYVHARKVEYSVNVDL